MPLGWCPHLLPEWPRVSSGPFSSVTHRSRGPCLAAAAVVLGMARAQGVKEALPESFLCV